MATDFGHRNAHAAPALPPLVSARASRRGFITAAGALAAAGALGGCTVQTTSTWPQGPPQPILPSPEGFTAADVLATPRMEGEGELERFLALSSLLTGFDDLNPVLGAVYLDALRNRPDPAVTLGALYERAGFGGGAAPDSLEALEAAGVFAEEEMSALADTILTNWYTGVYDTAEGEQAVATYVDALVWQAAGYLKPRTVCGPYPGFWRERPPVIP
jgi:hypothetical protein